MSALTGTSVRQALRRRARAEDGLALVEFALLMPVLALLLFGLLDFGKAFNYWIDETHLANEAARFAAVNKNPGASSGMTLQQYIRDQATTPELKDGGTASVASALQVCITFPGGSDVGDPVKVTVETTYRWLGLVADRLGITETPIRGQSTMRIEVPPTNYSAGCA